MNATDQITYTHDTERLPSRVIPLNSDLYTRSSEQDNLICTCADGLYVIPIQDISHCTAESNYVRIYFGRDQSVMASKTLQAVERCLPKQRFVRTHQSHLVSVDRISFLGSQEMVLTSGQRIPVSRSRRNVLRDLVFRNGIRL